MSSWHHRDWRITRTIMPPDVYEAKRGNEKREWPAKWGIAGVRQELEAEYQAEQQAEREREQAERARQRREQERLEHERQWLRRLPSTSCRRCGAFHVEAQPEQGPRLPLDPEPRPDGDWVAYACLVAGRVALVRRAAPGEPIADRYEVHHATCSGRPPMADPTGQLRLRLGKYGHRIDRPRTRRRRRAAHQMTLAPRAEQLEIPCPTLTT